MGGSTTTSNRYVQPAAIGGLLIGVLSSLPIVSAGNICCCLWVVLGGVVAAYLLQQNEPTPLSPGDGALVGLIAGFIGAFAGMLLSIPVALLMSPIQQAILSRLADGGNVPPEFRRYIGSGAMPGLGIVIGFVVMLFVGPIFGTLGGLLGAALFRKASPPPPTDAIDAPFTTDYRG